MVKNWAKISSIRNAMSRKAEVEHRVPLATDMFVPNHSGEHQKLVVRNGADITGAVSIAGDLTVQGITTTTLVVGAVDLTGQQIITGDADETQLIIRANSTQSNINPMIKFQKSDMTDLFSIHSDGQTNLFMGIGTGTYNTGTYNVFAGYLTGERNTTGSNNFAFGYNALRFNRTGTYNMCLGAYAGTGWVNQSFSRNTYIGAVAGYRCSTGVDNTAVGNSAGKFNRTGTGNSYIGANAGAGVDGNSHSFNTGVGMDVLYAVTTGGNNAIVGFRAGYAITIGSNNVLLGYQCGDNLTTGTRNIIIGYDLNATTATTNYEINIGGVIKGDVVTLATNLQGTLTTAGNISVTNATNPLVAVTDTTNTVTAKLQAGDGGGNVGTSTNHDFYLKSNNVDRVVVASGGDVTVNNNLAVAGGLSLSGDLSFAGSAGFYPRRISQAGLPSSGTGDTQVDVGELLLWRDTDDGVVRLVYNDAVTGVKSVALA